MTDTQSPDWRLFATTLVGALVVVATALGADAAGLTGATGFAAPALVGVSIGAGIKLAWDG